MKNICILTSINHSSFVLVGAKHSCLGIVVACQIHVPGGTLQESNGASLLHHWGAATKSGAASSHFIAL